MSGKVLVRQSVPLTLRHSKGEWNTFFNGLLEPVPAPSHTEVSSNQRQHESIRQEPPAERNEK